MLKYSCFLWLLLMTGLGACSKRLSKGDSGFTVTASKVVVNANDTTRFYFTGNPDIITFYSGEPGKRYEYKDRVQATGAPLVNFRTATVNGTQQNTLQLMISSDFKGVVKGDTSSTKANITAAAWTDITSRATLAVSGSPVGSGNVDLTDFASAGKPVYVAFKYSASAGSIQPKWTIDSFTVKNVLSDGTSYTIANMNSSTTPYSNYGVTTYSPGFASYTLQNKFNWSVSTSTMVITGATSAGTASDPSEAWVFIGPVNLRKVTPDAGKVVKSGSQNLGELDFYHFYNTPGNYKATFVGGRVSIEESSLTTRTIDITVQ